MSPSTHSPGAAEGDRHAEFASERGREAARWLDRDLLRPGATCIETGPSGPREVPDDDVSSAALLIKAHIRGMDSLARVRAWQAVERRLGRGADGGPRQRILTLLERREQFLLEHGERGERYDRGERTDEIPEKTVEWTHTDDGQRSTVANVGSRSVATDGGRDD